MRLARLTRAPTRFNIIEMLITCQSCALRFTSSDETVRRLVRQKRVHCHVCQGPLEVDGVPILELPFVQGTLLDRERLLNRITQCRARFGSAPRLLDAQRRTQLRLQAGEWCRFDEIDPWPILVRQWEAWATGRIVWAAPIEVPGALIGVDGHDALGPVVTSVEPRFDADAVELVEIASRLRQALLTPEPSDEGISLITQIQRMFHGAGRADIPFDVAGHGELFVVTAFWTRRHLFSGTPLELQPMALSESFALPVPASYWEADVGDSIATASIATVLPAVVSVE